ncbi:FAD-dependent oxidoreductase [Pleionea sediminis]|uniref:FAD-dependent oxidoreductase n=1 Tax=Pleionea sediminis TaxID=2569479 RepID=UPI0013DE49EF|nr:FAD-dependent oxidoreductase [Pleionea sediminis]
MKIKMTGILLFAFHSWVYAEQHNCDVIIAGGSTAALSAALTSARQGEKTCLLEPTDWPGGQLTASGVPAIDFAWHKVDGYDVGRIGKNAVNQPSELMQWLNQVGNTGDCRVSTYCFDPVELLTQAIQPAITRERNLTVFYMTVVKSVETEIRNGKNQIVRVNAIQRTPRENVRNNGFDKRLSEDIWDWYDVRDSMRYTKTNLSFSNQNKTPVVIDATEFGDVLVLSRASYLQGVEVSEGSTQILNDQLGQAMVFPFYMRLHSRPVDSAVPEITAEFPAFYDISSHGWEYVWQYRRVIGSGNSDAGEVSNQNWNPGNDYPYGYLFVPKSYAQQQINHWYGGLNFSTMQAAERHAFGWFHWFANRDPFGAYDYYSMDTRMSGTTHGLSKLPYLRDTRRSIGIDNFILSIDDLTGNAADKIATPFYDRLAMGVYAADIHPMQGSFPSYVYGEKKVLPFFIPFRALTNRDMSNLLVAGKTMAQSFMANAATRLQPIEFSSGIAAGSAASYMFKHQLSSQQALMEVESIRATAALYTPQRWSIDGSYYPDFDDNNSNNTNHLFCPLGAEGNIEKGYCEDAQYAYGPFTQTMTLNCQNSGGGSACTRRHFVLIAGRTVGVLRWSKSFTQRLRGTGVCMAGSYPDTFYEGYCIESSADSSSGTRQIYGPFEISDVERCIQVGGGDACYSNRWSYDFFRRLRQ